MRYVGLLIQWTLIVATAYATSVFEFTNWLGVPRPLRPDIKGEELDAVIATYIVCHGVAVLVSWTFREPPRFGHPRWWVVELALALVAFSAATFTLVYTDWIDVPFSPWFHATVITLVMLGYLAAAAIAAVISRRFLPTTQDAERPWGARDWSNAFAPFRDRWRVIGPAMVIGVMILPWAHAALRAREVMFDASHRLPARHYPPILDSPQTEWHLVDVAPRYRLIEPVDVAFTPTDPDALYALGFRGHIYRVTSSGETELLVDFTHEVRVLEEVVGAMGFALHPRFGDPDASQRGHVYVLYGRDGQDEHVTKLVRFDLSLPDAESRLGSITELIVLDRPENPLHFGGSVLFGPDGMLYFSTGDFGTFWSQSIDRTLSGGVFRIDVDQRGGDISSPIQRQPQRGRTQGYFIPRDNPFYGRADTLEEFYALGLRQPFRMSLDATTGEIWIGDVGAGKWEEITRLRAGDNGMWPGFEGNTPWKEQLPDRLIGNPRPPIHVYPHSSLGKSVIGGFVYRGQRHPTLYGRYLYADYISSLIRMLDFSQNPPEAATLASLGDVLRNGITALAPGLDGEVYVCVKGRARLPRGRIMRLTPGPPPSDGDGGGRVDDADPDTPTTEEIVQHKYELICARCHGLDGKGIPSMTVGLAPRPDFTSAKWQQSVTDAHIRKAIREGGLAVGKSKDMPAWADFFEGDQLDAVVRKVRAFRDD